MFKYCLVVVCFLQACLMASTEVKENDVYSPKLFKSPTNTYIVIDKLGEGVFGEVYSVESENGEKFALKSYKIKKIQSYEIEDQGDAFIYALMDSKRELERGQLFNHPSIIKSYELFSTVDEDGVERNNLLLELVEGSILHNIKKKQLSKQASLNAVASLIDALRHALSLGLIHLDLHQGNLMINNDQEVKLIDLASFFTYEEIVKFIELGKNDGPSSEEYPSIQNGGNGVKSMRIMASKKEENGLDAGKLRRLEKFFALHPKLKKKIEEEVVKQQKIISGSTAMMKSVKNKALNPEEEISSTLSKELSTFNAYYFERIADMCTQIIAKSDATRNEKIELRAEIMKLAWNYQEDIDEGQKIPVDVYLNELVGILN